MPGLSAKSRLNGMSSFSFIGCLSSACAKIHCRHNPRRRVFSTPRRLDLIFSISGILDRAGACHRIRETRWRATTRGKQTEPGILDSPLPGHDELEAMRRHAWWRLSYYEKA